MFFLQRALIIPNNSELGTWKVTTLSYEYAIERSKDRQEVIAFHWEGFDAVNPIPHIHIGFAGNDKSTPFTPKNHIPSGRVLVEDIVRFVIDEMGVHPTKARRLDWKSIVAAARAAVMKHKTW